MVKIRIRIKTDALYPILNVQVAKGICRQYYFDHFCINLNSLSFYHYLDECGVLQNADS